VKTSEDIHREIMKRSKPCYFDSGLSCGLYPEDLVKVAEWAGIHEHHLNRALAIAKTFSESGRRSPRAEVQQRVLVEKHFGHFSRQLEVHLSYIATQDEKEASLFPTKNEGRA
jgi:sulfite reductase beta subunit-like hemoprotein